MRPRGHLFEKNWPAEATFISRPIATMLTWKQLETHYQRPCTGYGNQTNESLTLHILYLGPIAVERALAGTKNGTKFS